MEKIKINSNSDFELKFRSFDQYLLTQQNFFDIFRHLNNSIDSLLKKNLTAHIKT